MDAREIYGKLKECSHFRVSSKITKSITDDTVVGFWCHVNSELGYSKKVQMAADWCFENKLPVEVFAKPNDAGTGFKIMIEL